MKLILFYYIAFCALSEEKVQRKTLEESTSGEAFPRRFF